MKTLIAIIAINLAGLLFLSALKCQEQSADRLNHALEVIEALKVTKGLGVTNVYVSNQLVTVSLVITLQTNWVPVLLRQVSQRSKP